MAETPLNDQAPKEEPQVAPKGDSSIKDDTHALLEEIANDLKTQVEIDLSEFSVKDQIKIMRKMIAAQKAKEPAKNSSPPEEENEEPLPKKKPNPPKTQNPASSEVDADALEYTPLAIKNAKGSPWERHFAKREDVTRFLFEPIEKEK